MFLGVDVRVAGKTYRVVNTHLEVKQPDPTNPGRAISERGLCPRNPLLGEESEGAVEAPSE